MASSLWVGLVGSLSSIRALIFLSLKAGNRIAHGVRNALFLACHRDDHDEEGCGLAGQALFTAPGAVLEQNASIADFYCPHRDDQTFVVEYRLLIFSFQAGEHAANRIGRRRRQAVMHHVAQASGFEIPQKNRGIEVTKSIQLAEQGTARQCKAPARFNIEFAGNIWPLFQVYKWFERVFLPEKFQPDVGCGAVLSSGPMLHKNSGQVQIS